MIHQNSMSSERLARSPSVTFLPSPSEIKGRLSFSSVKTSPMALRRLSTPTVDRPTYLGGRLGDYHMSKQNPAVLDEMFSPPTSPQKYRLYKTPSPLFNHTNHHHRALLTHQNGRTPFHHSLLRQVLNNHRRNSYGGPSLVHLATRGKQRNCDSVPVSPVIVQLSGPNKWADPSCHGDRREEERQEQVVANPCDKNVVISALKQSRKRWASSVDENSSILPTAKRVRPNSERQESPVILTYHRLPPQRKRPSESTAVSERLKKARVAQQSATAVATPWPKKASNKIIFPEIECEAEFEDEVANEEEEEEERGSVARETSSTPPVQEEEEDEQIKKRREESLKLQRSLTTVFPPSLSRRSSSRRKLPVFCATGSKPHLPPPLSSSHSATLEDLQKDREAAAAKMKEFLSGDEEETKSEPSPPTSISVPSLPLPSTSTSAPSTTTITNPLQGIRFVSEPQTTTTGESKATQPSLPAATSQLPAISLPSSTGISFSSLLPHSAVTSTSLPAANSVSASLSLTPLTNDTSAAATTTASITAPLISTGQTGLMTAQTSQMVGSAGLQFKGGLKTATELAPASKSVSFALPTVTTTSVTQATSTQSTLATQPAQQMQFKFPSGGLQFNSGGLKIGGEMSGTLAVPSSSQQSVASLTTAVSASTAALPAFQFPAALQLNTVSMTTRAPANTVAMPTLTPLSNQGTQQLQPQQLQPQQLQPQQLQPQQLQPQQLQPQQLQPQQLQPQQLQPQQQQSSFSLTGNLQFGAHGGLFGPKSATTTAGGLIAQQPPTSSSTGSGLALTQQSSLQTSSAPASFFTKPSLSSRPGDSGFSFNIGSNMSQKGQSLIQQSQGLIQQSQGGQSLIPQSQGLIPQSQGGQSLTQQLQGGQSLIPQSQGLIPQSQGGQSLTQQLQGGQSLIPQSQGLIQQSQGGQSLIPQSQGLIQQSQGGQSLIPQSQGLIPQSQGGQSLIPQSQGLIQQSQGGQSLIPQSQGLIPQSQGGQSLTQQLQGGQSLIQPSGKSLFSQNASNSTNGKGGLLNGLNGAGLVFNFSGNSQGGGLNFSAGTQKLGRQQSQQTQQKAVSFFAGVGGNAASNQTAHNGFNFSSRAVSLGQKNGSTGLFGGNIATSSAPTSFNFSTSQNQAPSGLFGSQQSGGPMFNFSAGMNSGQSQGGNVFNFSGSSGQSQNQNMGFDFMAGVNSGQSQSQGAIFNFSGGRQLQAQTQNGNTGFNFTAGSNTNFGQVQNGSGGLFTMTGGVAQNPGNSMFGTGNGNQTNSQAPGFGFQTPPTQTPTNFNFPANLGGSPFSFTANEQPLQPPRAIARPRRRTKKK